MKNELKALVDKRFKVLVGGEVERNTNFLGFMKLLADYSDFFQYTPKEQNDYLKMPRQDMWYYIDANISVQVI